MKYLAAFLLWFCSILATPLQAVSDMSITHDRTSGEWLNIHGGVNILQLPGPLLVYYNLGNDWLELGLAEQSIGGVFARGYWIANPGPMQFNRFVESITFKFGANYSAAMASAGITIPVLPELGGEVSTGEGTVWGWVDRSLPFGAVTIDRTNGLAVQPTASLFLHLTVTQGPVAGLRAVKIDVDNVTTNLAEWTAAIGESTQTFGGFKNGDSFVLMLGSSIIGQHTFQGLEGAPPDDYTMHLDLEGTPPDPDPDPDPPPTPPLPDPPSPPSPRPDPPLDPGTVPPPPTTADPREQIQEMDRQSRIDTAQIEAYLKSIEENIRETRDEMDTRRGEASTLGNWGMDNLPQDNPTGAGLLAQMPPEIRSLIDENMSKGTATMSMPAWESSQ